MTTSSKHNSFGSETLLNPIWSHLQQRPIGAHVLGWIVVGFAMGILLAPSPVLTAYFAFGLSGAVMGLIISVPTYPTSDGVLPILLGAIVGLTITFATTQFGYASHPKLLPFGLILGALIAGTCLPWLLFLRLIHQSLFGKASL